MASIPAICMNTSCLTMFPSGFAVENSRNIIFNECKSSPCPKCGGVGKIPDGTYSVIEDVIFATINNNLNKALLNKIKTTIERELSRAKSPKNIKKKLTKTFPKQMLLWNNIPKEKRDALWYLNFILLAAGSIAAIVSATHALMSDDEKTTIINNFNYEHNEYNAKPLAPYNGPAYKIPPPEKAIKL